MQYRSVAVHDFIRIYIIYIYIHLYIKYDMQMYM